MSQAWFAAVLTILVIGSAPTVVAQPQLTSDPFEDDAARELVLNYLASVEQTRLDPNALQVLLTNRQRVGFLLPRQWNWRARTLFHKETAALLDFGQVDARPPTLVGKTRGSPIIGDRLLDNGALWGWFGFDPESDSPALFGLVGFALATLARDIPQGDEGLHGFDKGWLDPLTTGGLTRYSYRTGPPLKTSSGVLRSVEVESRGTEATRLVGAIWFGPGGEPVRAMYRPSGRWPLRSGLRGYIRAVPLVPKDAQGEIDFLTLSYSGSPPLPVNAELNGTMWWFYDQGVFPVRMEWELDWSESFDSPVAVAALAASGGGARPTEGAWVVPPETAFGDTSVTPPPMRAGWGFRTPRKELHPYQRELDRITGRPPLQSFGRTASSAIASIRFNQVQGINFSIRYPWYVSPNGTVNAGIGLATSGFDPVGELEYFHRVKPRYWGVAAYSRLKDANWMEQTNGLMSGITALFGGYDDGNYYRASGARVTAGVLNHPFSGLLELFIEGHEDAPKTATYSLFGPPDSLPPDLEVEEGMIGGVRGGLNLQYGDDAQRGVFVGRLFGQAAAGDFDFFSAGISVDVVGPLLWRLAGAVRGTLGLADGDVPSQSLWYLGGIKTVRGYPANSVSGETAYVINAEIGSDIPLIRLVAFCDVGWAATFEELFDAEPLLAVGPGLSFLDGVVRIDVATGLTRNGTTRIHFSISALF